MDIRPIVEKENIYREQINAPRLSLAEAKKKAAEIEDKLSPHVLEMIWGKDCHDYISHGESVARYAMSIAKYLGMPKRDVINISYISIVHDIGKMRIPRYILDKNTDNSRIEEMILREHPLTGKALLMQQFLYASDIVLCHHERLDGSGYPLGIKSSNIPYEAKIIAVADVYDGMVSKRNYQKQSTPREAADYLIANRNVLFDGEIVDALISHLKRTRIL